MKPIACVIGGKLMKYSNDPLPDECLLYPEREWVGLTEQEAADCWSTSAVQTWHAIEAALKEKNDIRK